MSSFALLLVMTGALLHAIWNTAAKQAAGGAPFVWLYGAVSCVFAIPCCVYAWWQQPFMPDWTTGLAIFASACIHVVYGLVLQRGYRASDFSIVYPLARGTGPLFAIVGAVMLLHEMPSARGWAGIALIVLGILLIAGITRLLCPAPHVMAGVFWGCATGMCIAAYTVVDGWAVKSLGVAPLLYYAASLLVRTVILAPHAWRSPKMLRAQWAQNRRAVLLVGLLSPLAYLLVLQAMTLAPLSYVAPVRELSMLIGVLMGAKLLREALNPARIVGTLLLVGGIALVVAA